jgi:hypothetical protein
MDPEIEELPTDYMRGLDFKIVKSQKGGYADYSTSGWARKESALTEVEQAAIEAHGLFNLREFLPKKPSDAEKRIIREMFDASVSGRPYDPDKWGAYYKPWGLQVSNTRSEESPAEKQQSTPVTTVVASRVVEEDSEPEVEQQSQSQAPVSGDKTQDILRMIRERQNKPA